MTCGNCGRLLSARECADPEHRAARGCDELAIRGLRECVKCHETKPFRSFFAKFSGTRFGRSGVTLGPDAGRSYKTCNTCRFTKKARSKAKAVGKVRHERATTEAYWDQQAARHM